MNCPNRQFEDYYALQGQIGTGFCGKVFRCVHRDSGHCFAVKQLNIRRLEKENPLFTKERVVKEAELMALLDHPKIIKVVDLFVNDHEVYIVMEILHGGDLFDRLIEQGRYSEESARLVVMQVLDALAFLHGRGIVHRDLKPENILLENPTDHTTLKLADFGLAKDATQPLRTFCGTPQYCAPEISLCQQGGGGYGTAVDIWSLGVVTFVILCGRFPFVEDKTPPELLWTRTVGEGCAEWMNLSAEAKDFVLHLLQVDASLRPTAEQVRGHPWLSSIRKRAGKRPKLRSPMFSLINALGKS